MKKIGKLVAFLLVMIMTAAGMVTPAAATSGSVESISAVQDPTLTIYEKLLGNTEYEYDEDTQDLIGEYYKYSLDEFCFQYTITYDGGQTLKGSIYDVAAFFGETPSVSDDQSYYNQWDIGSHRVAIDFMGKSCEADIEIVENPVESISAVPTRTILEKSEGSVTTGWDIQGQPHEYYHYNIAGDLFRYPVTYNGGQTFTGNYYEVQQAFGGNWYSIMLNMNQSYMNQWGVGSHTVTIDYMGKSCETEVVIAKSPIESISAVFVGDPLIEKVDGYLRGENMFDPESPQFFCYNVQTSDFQFTVKYSGGKTFTGTDIEVSQKFGNMSTFVSCSTDQSYENQWGIGKHKVKFEFLGNTCEADIAVVKNPIESLSVATTTSLIENADGWVNNNESEEYFYYFIESNMFRYTVKYDGGKTFTGTAEELGKKFGKYFDSLFFETNQSYETPWHLGMNNITVRFMGRSCNTQIEVKKSPIESISAVPVGTLTEKIDGGLGTHWSIEDGLIEYYVYDPRPDMFRYTITYDGGKVFTGTADELENMFDKTRYSVLVLPIESYDDPWDVGMHKASIQFLGKSCEADIEVVKGPWDTFTEDDTLLNLNGSWYYVKDHMVNKFGDPTLCKYKGIWFYISEGEINWEFDGIVWYHDIRFHAKGGSVNLNEGPTLVYDQGDWCYTRNGQVDMEADTLVQYKGVWFHVKDGYANLQEEPTLVKYNGVWFYVKNGQVDWNSDTLVKFGGVWFHVKGGKVDFKEAPTLTKYNNTWFYVKGGQVDWKADTLVKYKNVWFHVKGGSVNFSESATLIKYSNTWFYVKGGQVDWNSDTLVKFGGVWFHVKGGSVRFGEAPTLTKYNGTWFYVKNGQVDWNANTLVKYNGSWFCIKNGTVAWNFTGTVRWGNSYYRVVKGVVR